MSFKMLLSDTFQKWSPLFLVWLFLIPPKFVQAQLGLAGRNNTGFRLNLLRSEVITPHGQQPPYEWSAVYLRNITSNVQPKATFVLDSSVCGYGVPNTSDFGEEFKIYYSYDNQGQLSEIVFRQEGSPGAYENYSRKTYTYDSEGKRTNYLYQLWNGSAWEDDYEEQITYNGNGKQEGFMIREKGMSGQWNNLFRQMRNYDTAGNVIEVLSARWNNNAWQDTARKEILYNSIGFYTELFDETWNGSGWDTLSKETAVYDNLGMIWEGYLFEEKTQNGFEGVVREGYQYDTYGFWTGMTRQLWDNAGGSWENDLKETYEYNRSGVWLGWAQETYQDTGWVNHIRQFYKKSGAIRQDLMQDWDTMAGAWNDRFRMLTQYDSNGNLIQEAGIQSWDGNNSTWGNTEKSRRCLHSWSPINATSLDPQLPELSCTLANPYRVYEPISCESMEQGKQYDVRLMDMQGRTVYQKSVPGGDVFSVDRTLPTGIYHLSIYENQQMRFLRKIVINH